MSLQTDGIKLKTECKRRGRSRKTSLPSLQLEGARTTNTMINPPKRPESVLPTDSLYKKEEWPKKDCVAYFFCRGVFKGETREQFIVAVTKSPG